MAASQTQEEVRAEYIATMGAELGELHYLLRHDVTWLHLKWLEFRELFGTKPSRIHLMNETAPQFFSALEDVLWADVLLHLSRLTDPAATSGQQNLTFRRYPPLVARLPIREPMHAALDRVEAASRFARDWRDRRLAHRDYRHARDPAAQPLAAGSRASVEEALAAIRDLMQVPELHFCQATVAYEHVVRAPGGSWDLLYHLDMGLEAKHSKEANGTLWRAKYL